MTSDNPQNNRVVSFQTRSVASSSCYIQEMTAWLRSWIGSLIKQNQLWVFDKENVQQEQKLL